MVVVLDCPTCEARVRVHDSSLGKCVTCPLCTETFFPEDVLKSSAAWSMTGPAAAPEEAASTLSADAVEDLPFALESEFDAAVDDAEPAAGTPADAVDTGSSTTVRRHAPTSRLVRASRWGFGGLAVVLIVSIAAWGLARPKWTRYTSIAGRYSVLFPGKPIEVSRLRKDFFGQQIMCHEAVVLIDQSTMGAVRYVDVPGSGPLLNEKIDDLLTRVGGLARFKLPSEQILRDEPITLGGQRGWRFIYRSESITYEVHMVVIGERHYDMLFACEKPREMSDVRKKFFDSFQLTFDPEMGADTVRDPEIPHKPAKEAPAPALPDACKPPASSCGE